MREYERTVTTVVNATLRPRCRAYLRASPDVAGEVLVMTSAGGLLPWPTPPTCPPPCCCPDRPGGVRPAAAVAVGQRVPRRHHLRHGRHQHRRVPGARRGPAPAPRSARWAATRAVPGPRHPHHRRRRRVDRHARPRRRPAGGAPQRRRRPRPGLLRPGRHRAHGHRRRPRRRPHPRRRGLRGPGPRRRRRGGARWRRRRDARGRDPVVDAAMERACGRCRWSGASIRRSLALVAFGGPARCTPAPGRCPRHAGGDRAARAGVLSAVGLLTSRCQRTSCARGPPRSTTTASPTPGGAGGRGRPSSSWGRRRRRPRSTAATPARATSSRCRRRRRLPRGPPAAQRLRPPDAPVEVVAIRATGDGPSASTLADLPAPRCASSATGHGGARRARLHDLDPRRLVGRAGAAGALVLRREAVTPRPRRAAGADLPARRHRRRDGSGAAAGRRRARTSRSGPTARRRCSPPRATCWPRPSTSRAPRLDAGVGAGGHRRLRRPARPGDHVVVNDPFAGGTHLNDITVVTPVFDDGAGSSAGWPTGPTTPTSAAPPRVDPRRRHRDPAGGLRIPPARYAEELRGLLLAGVPHARRAGRRPRRPARRQRGRRRAPGSRSATEPFHEVIDYGERRMRAVLAALPDGRGGSRTWSTPPAPRPDQQRPAASW